MIPGAVLALAALWLYAALTIGVALLALTRAGDGRPRWGWIVAMGLSWPLWLPIAALLFWWLWRLVQALSAGGRGA